MKRSLFGLLIYWIVVVAAIVLLTLWAAGLARASIADCIDATCRITTADGSRGTGCAFERSGGYVFVLTAAHVVGSERTVRCEFWRRGHLSSPMPATVVRRSPGADAALVAVSESAFGGLLPKIVPMAPRDYVLRPGTTLSSVGCAHGSWSTGWKGHALGYQGSDLHFVPPPANGRSGSAVFDAKGERIVALLRARTIDNSQGIATSVQALYRAFSQSGKQKAESRGSAFRFQLSALTQCPDGSCPTTPWRLSPYRQRQDQRDGSQDGRIGQLERTWPTLPAPAPQPTPAPSVDLSPLVERLDRIGRNQERIIQGMVEFAKQNETAGRDAERESKADEKADVDTAREENSKLRQAINTLIGDRETLKERFDTRIAKVKEELGEDAGRRDVARAYVKDLVQEKLGDGTLGLTTGRLLGGALGLSAPLAFAIGLGLWLVSRRMGHKMESGDPLLVQRLFDRVSDKIDNLKDRVGQEQKAESGKRK